MGVGLPVDAVEPLPQVGRVVVVGHDHRHERREVPRRQRPLVMERLALLVVGRHRDVVDPEEVTVPQAEAPARAPYASLRPAWGSGPSARDTGPAPTGSPAATSCRSPRRRSSRRPGSGAGGAFPRWGRVADRRCRTRALLRSSAPRGSTTMAVVLKGSGARGPRTSRVRGGPSACLGPLYAGSGHGRNQGRPGRGVPQSRVSTTPTTISRTAAHLAPSIRSPKMPASRSAPQRGSRSRAAPRPRRWGRASWPRSTRHRPRRRRPSPPSPSAQSRGRRGMARAPSRAASPPRRALRPPMKIQPT